MALIVYYKQPNGNITSVEFHCHERVGDEHNIVKIMADSTELDMILCNCKNIPHVDQRIQTWYGDTAKFIATNYNRTLTK
jgi:hypothetical protein